MQNFLNKVFNKDVLEVLKELPDNSIDMIYSDPDYNVGINYNGKKYTKKWEEYINWYIQLAKESLRVLKPTGNMFFINYPKQNAYLRVKFLDENAYDVFDYVWIYNTNVGHSPRRFTTAHRSVLHVVKSKNNKFFKENIALPYQNPEDKRIKERIKRGEKGRMPYSWFYFDLVKNVSKEKTIHSCQLPIAMFEMFLLATTEPNDSVFIHFGGSGNEIVLTKKLNRNFISCEIHPFYYQMILDKLKTEKIDDEKYRFIKVKNKVNNKNFLLFDL